MTGVDDALNRLRAYLDDAYPLNSAGHRALARVRQRLAEQDTETQRLREERDEWRESRLALMQTITEQGQRAEAAEAENRRLQHQIESLRNALAAYRSALRSGEGESEHLRAVGDRALLAGSEAEPDEGGEA